VYSSRLSFVALSAAVLPAVGLPLGPPTTAPPPAPVGSSNWVLSMSLLVPAVAVVAGACLVERLLDADQLERQLSHGRISVVLSVDDAVKRSGLPSSPHGRPSSLRTAVFCSVWYFSTERRTMGQ
jgi:hypothetical protein